MSHPGALSHGPHNLPPGRERSDLPRCTSGGTASHHPSRPVPPAHPGPAGVRCCQGQTAPRPAPPRASALLAPHALGPPCLPHSTTPAHSACCRRPGPARPRRDQRPLPAPRVQPVPPRAPTSARKFSIPARGCSRPHARTAPAAAPGDAEPETEAGHTCARAWRRPRLQPCLPGSRGGSR